MVTNTAKITANSTEILALQTGTTTVSDDSHYTPSFINDIVINDTRTVFVGGTVAGWMHQLLLDVFNDVGRLDIEVGALARLDIACVIQLDRGE